MSNASNGLDACAVRCPYCGEPVELVIDASAGAQRHVEDCTVCCRPMEVAVEVGADGAHVRVHQENEA